MFGCRLRLGLARTRCGQTISTLGLLQFLLRLRCQGGGLGGDSLISRGRVRRGQGGPAYSERFLQGSLWIAWYRAQINWYFSAYGVALAIRASRIGIARATLGIRASNQEMRLFVLSHFLVALTQGRDSAPGRGIQLLWCARCRHARVPARGLCWLPCLFSHSRCRLLPPSYRNLHAV